MFASLAIASLAVSEQSLEKPNHLEVLHLSMATSYSNGQELVKTKTIFGMIARLATDLDHLDSVIKLLCSGLGNQTSNQLTA
jgi:hypothetical protein